MSFMVNRIEINGKVLVDGLASVTEYLTPSGAVLYYAINVSENVLQGQVDKVDYLITPNGMIFYLKK